MKLHFSFNNGTPPVDLNVDMLQATPLELLVSGNGSSHSRKKALSAYLRSLDYMFRGVSNYASGDIRSVSIEKDWFGKMEKVGDRVNWTAVVDKSFVVIYDLNSKSITEHMYVADAVAVGGKKGKPNEVTPVWIRELLNPSSKSKNSIRDHIIKSISVVTEYISDYRLVYGLGGENNLTILDKNNKPVKIDEIDDDETFILVKLLTLIMGKGIHWGVFIIDGSGFSEKLISAFVEVAQLFFGDAYIFLHNCRENIKVDRVKVTLPNFYATGQVDE